MPVKCRACWADDAHLWNPGGWRAVLARLLMMAPVKCRHCFHCFLIPAWRVRGLVAQGKAHARLPEGPRMRKAA